MANLSKNSVTLVELLLAVALMGVMTLATYGLYYLSRIQLANSLYRTQVQNELSYVLEDMSKNIVRAVGETNNRGILDLAPTYTGFSVRVDVNGTPQDYSDDTTINYTLSGNRINKNGVNLTTRDIIPAGGFSYSLFDNGTGIEISLTGRYRPTQDASSDNPQITLKTKAYSHSASRN